MNLLLRPTLAMLLTASSLVAVAQDAAPRAAPAAPVLDIQGITCRYLLTAGGDERDLLLSFFHGYFAGKAGPEAVHDVGTMADLTDAVIDWCVDHPRATLLRAYTEAGTADRADR